MTGPGGAGSPEPPPGGFFPAVYDELKRLAAARLAGERAEHSLDATALVHEAYLRLIGDQPAAQARGHWNSRGHFFAAAAEAMRRILIEQTRRKRRQKHGGGLQRVELDDAVEVADAPLQDLLELDEALNRLQSADPLAAKLVNLRYFAGLTMPQAAEALGITLRTAERNWTYARTWLHREITATDPDRRPPSA